jgi:hypothetical protein
MNVRELDDVSIAFRAREYLNKLSPLLIDRKTFAFVL